MSENKTIAIIFCICIPLGVCLGDKMIAAENAQKQKCVAAGGVPVNAGLGNWICANPAVVIRY